MINYYFFLSIFSPFDQDGREVSVIFNYSLIFYNIFINLTFNNYRAVQNQLHLWIQFWKDRWRLLEI